MKFHGVCPHGTFRTFLTTSGFTKCDPHLVVCRQLTPHFNFTYVPADAGPRFDVLRVHSLPWVRKLV